MDPLFAAQGLGLACTWTSNHKNIWYVSLVKEPQGNLAYLISQHVCPAIRMSVWKERRNCSVRLSDLGQGRKPDEFPGDMEVTQGWEKWHHDSWHIIHVAAVPCNCTVSLSLSLYIYTHAHVFGYVSMCDLLCIQEALNLVAGKLWRWSTKSASTGWGWVEEQMRIAAEKKRKQDEERRRKHEEDPSCKQWYCKAL